MIHPLKIAFIGNASISADLLAKLLSHLPEITGSIELCICGKDKPAGRGLQLAHNPVAEVAEKNQIEVTTLSCRKETAQVGDLLRRKDIDVAIVFAYGEIIPKSLLSSLRLGFINVHPSLLPRYRGPSPIQFPLMLGESVTGTTLIVMDEHMDTGAIVHQKEYALPSDMNAQTLLQALIDESMPLLLKYLARPESASLRKQPDHGATYTFKVTRDDGYISVEDIQKLLLGQSIDTLPVYKKYAHKNNLESPSHTDSTLIYALFRAFTPWPGIWTTIQKDGKSQRLKICNMWTDGTRLVIQQVQLEGKKPVDFETFNRAYQVFK